MMVGTAYLNAATGVYGGDASTNYTSADGGTWERTNTGAQPLGGNVCPTTDKGADMNKNTNDV
jgi:hypothetical protein